MIFSRFDKVSYLLILLGLSLDYLSTCYGLSLGLRESRLTYSPLFALALFSALRFSFYALYQKKQTPDYKLLVCALICLSFLGFVNNSLVILGVFEGF